jgi:hypothetical protein
MKYDQSPSRGKFRSLLVLLSLLLIAGLSCDRIGAKRQIKDRLAAIQKAREPATAEELDKWYEEPGPGENAAPILEESFSSLVMQIADTAKLPVVGRAPLPARLSAEMKRDVAQFLSKNEKALNLLHKAAALKKCRFPVDLKKYTKGEPGSLPHFMGIRSSAKLLQLEAIFNAESGKTAEAVQAVVTSLRLCRFLDLEPPLITQLVRLANQSLSCSNVEQILNRASLSDDQLSTLLAAFQEEEDSVGVARCLIGERCVGIVFFQLPPKERAARVADLAATQEAVKQDKPVEQSSMDADFAFFLQAMEESIAASKLPYPKRFDARDRLNRRSGEAKSKGYPYSEMVLSYLAKLISKEARSLAQLRCAVGALAVQRYRLAHGNNLPASLEETVPAFLKAVPVDPYRGNPLRYRRESAIHFVVSSVGEDDSSRELTFEVKR